MRSSEATGLEGIIERLPDGRLLVRGTRLELEVLASA
jgi:hypothetical protein